ncbi:TetR/AcrR family transcriptional regulator C-terminal domain-containing protein [Streptosporangium sp. NBC_01639]|uniref:TetR/AcrR family transcriptional regulator C-terminal domain-containing protein n=1 Tax=Streptosporangium sp. NBC_01639 TaxID=2975948 RepID=UPI00386336C8|nr:TetR/AcrR family transcriptional regulator C-terminal domain-containing protein [Streptosporangium sp. NBC_01639]
MGRPRQSLLSRERIFAEALALVDEKGADALSMARLAGRLGVQAASLYNHVTGRDEIVEGIRWLVVSEMDIAVLGGGPWQESLATWARSYMAALARHPNTAKLLATTTIRTPLSLEMYERVVILLEDAGWPRDQVVSVFTVIESFAIGSALDLVAPSIMIDPAEQSNSVPRLAAALKGDRPDRAKETFELGLTALLSGLVVLRRETVRDGAGPLGAPPADGSHQGR